MARNALVNCLPLLLFHIKWLAAAEAQLAGECLSSDDDLSTHGSLSLLQLSVHQHAADGIAHKKALVENDASVGLDVILDDTHTNLCQQDKHLPELYILGCQKCASTSFADDLLAAGYNTVHSLNPNDPHRKYFHLFKEVYDWYGKLDRENFLKLLPPCGQYPGVLASFSADLFHLTNQSDLFLKIDEQKHFDVTLNVPQTLYQFYGQQDIKRPLFVTLLREPLERFQSSFYFFKDTSETMWNTGVSHKNFNHFARKSVDLALDTGMYNSILRPSMYGKHLGEYLKYVDPSQFVIIPMYNYVRDGSGWAAACHVISSRLSTFLKCSEHAPAAVNQGEHPSLSEDLDDRTRKHFYKFIEHDHQMLLQMLLLIHQKGGSLVEFDGTDTTEDIHAWISKGWSSGH